MPACQNRKQLLHQSYKPTGTASGAARACRTRTVGGRTLWEIRWSTALILWEGVHPRPALRITGSSMPTIPFEITVPGDLSQEPRPFVPNGHRRHRGGERPRRGCFPLIEERVAASPLLRVEFL